MFTGIVERLVKVQANERRASGHRLVLEVGDAMQSEPPVLGESIAINGCCLTVVETAGELLSFDVGPESLHRTNLGRMSAEDRVNIERSVRAMDRLGGHYVTGHVDALGTLAERDDDGEWSTLWFEVPAKLTAQMVSKGSITVDGVSLTLVDVEANRFSVALIPHTLAVTTLGRLKVGDTVNIETDVLAKYVERQLQAGTNSSNETTLK